MKFTKQLLKGAFCLFILFFVGCAENPLVPDLNEGDTNALNPGGKDKNEGSLTANNDIDGDGIPNNQDNDIDGDGILNINDKDIDGDDILNINDNDIDGDGVANESDSDIDGDGVANIDDKDIDGDGILNVNDIDIDGDGIINVADLDLDGDGIPNERDSDIDGDGITNLVDLDIDGDGVGNGVDPDVDGDGITNGSDPDVDGDGVVNANDSTIQGNVDSGSSGPAATMTHNESFEMNIDGMGTFTGEEYVDFVDIRQQLEDDDIDLPSAEIQSISIKGDTSSYAFFEKYADYEYEMVVSYSLPGSSEQKVFLRTAPFGGTTFAPEKLGGLKTGVVLNQSLFVDPTNWTVFSQLFKNTTNAGATLHFEYVVKGEIDPADYGKLKMNFSVDVSSTGGL